MLSLSSMRSGVLLILFSAFCGETSKMTTRSGQAFCTASFPICMMFCVGIPPAAPWYASVELMNRSARMSAPLCFAGSSCWCASWALLAM